MKTEHEHKTPVIRRYSGDIIGYCRIHIKFLTDFEDTTLKDSQVVDKSKEISPKLSTNSKVVFEVKILELTGIKRITIQSSSCTV
jgi:hypothetical protein